MSGTNEICEFTLDTNERCSEILCHFFFCFVTAPLDSPQNFVNETINSTSIQLYWDQPSTPNGEIINYSLVYSGLFPGSLELGPFSIMDTMFIVNDLNGYSDYVFSIAAATSAGLGPYALTIGRTAEDGVYV